MRLCATRLTSYKGRSSGTANKTGNLLKLFLKSKTQAINLNFDGLPIVKSMGIKGDEYKIVNKEGITLEELSNPRSKHYVKLGMAIQPGETADLVRKDWIPTYKKLGRDRTIELVGNGTSLKEAKKIAKEETTK